MSNAVHRGVHVHSQSVITGAQPNILWMPERVNVFTMLSERMPASLNWSQNIRDKKSDIYSETKDFTRSWYDSLYSSYNTSISLTISSFILPMARKRMLAFWQRRKAHRGNALTQKHRQRVPILNILLQSLFICVLEFSRW